jgi:predicted type IV restriction endonuclease
MDFKGEINNLAERVSKMKNQVLTEEATKNAFVLPFIKALGYDIFNPMEVVPELVADVGAKKGEKVDYAIFHDDKPIIIIECKCWKDDLAGHHDQLYRYFTTTESKFAVLTNGIRYMFYSDLEETNKLDKIPFLDFEITNLTETILSELQKFQKTDFEISKIIDTATELKITNEIKRILQDEFKNPTPEFIKHFIRQIHAGNATDRVINQFSDIFKKSVTQLVDDLVDERLKAALNKGEPLELPKQGPEVVVEQTKTELTDEEKEGYYIVRTILRGRGIKPDRIFLKDNISYCGILLDDNNRKTICRFWFNSPKKKYIGLFDTGKSETKHQIESLDDLYNFEEQLLQIIKYYDSQQ